MPSTEKTDLPHKLDEAARELGRAIHIRKQSETTLGGWRDYHTEKVAPGYVGAIAQKVAETRQAEQEALDAFVALQGERPADA